jgi:hypothetical protein
MPDWWLGSKPERFGRRLDDRLVSREQLGGQTRRTVAQRIGPQHADTGLWRQLASLAIRAAKTAHDAPAVPAEIELARPGQQFERQVAQQARAVCREGNLQTHGTSFGR